MSTEPETMDALILEALRPAAVAKFRGACLYCGRAEGLECHPMFPGGAITLDTVVVCCPLCDLDRGDLSHGDYLAGPVAAAHGFNWEAESR